MAEGGFDDYEMKEREQEQEQEQEREREMIEEQELEQETNFNDVDAHNVLIRPDDTTHTRVDIDDIDDIPNVRQDVGSIKRAITSDVKKSFKDIFDITINKKNGPNSTAILDQTKFISSKNGKASIEYKGGRIGWVGKNLEVDLFEKKNKKLVNEFRSKLDLARKEYERSPSALVRDLPENVVDDILNSSIKRIDQKIDETAASLSEQDLREFAGIFDPKGATAERKIVRFRGSSRSLGERVTESSGSKDRDLIQKLGELSETTTGQHKTKNQRETNTRRDHRDYK